MITLLSLPIIAGTIRGVFAGLRIRAGSGSVSLAPVIAARKRFAVGPFGPNGPTAVDHIVVVGVG